MLLFAACENKITTVSNVERKFSSSMEDDGWMNQHTIIKGFGHTGVYCSKIDTVNRFSYGFTRMFKNIDSTFLPTRVEIHFWTLFKKTGVTTNLVVSVDNSVKNIYWAGLDLKDNVKKADEWQYITAAYSLPAEIKPDDRISIYVWNPNDNVCYIDDLEVKFYK